MAVIENLDIVLAAKTEKLDAGLGAAGRSVAGLKTRFAGAAGELANFEPTLPLLGRASGLLAGLGPQALAAGAAIGVVTIGFTALGKVANVVLTKVIDQFSEIDNLGKVADTIGIATDQLGALRLAASETSGAAANEVDQALKGMVVRIGQAANGTGDAVQALDALGLSARAMVNLTPDRQFAALADTIHLAGNETQQLVVASKIFGEEGAKLVTTLRQGPDYLQEMHAWGTKFGLVLTDVQVNGVAAMNDNLSKIGGLLTGFAATIAVEIAPVVNVIASDLLSIVNETDGFANSTASAGAHMVVVYGTLKDIAGLLLEVAGMMINPFDGIDPAKVQRAMVGGGAADALMDYREKLQEAQDAAAKKAQERTAMAMAQAQAVQLTAAQNAADALNSTLADPSDKLSGALDQLEKLRTDGLPDPRNLPKATDQAAALTRRDPPSFGALQAGSAAAYVQALRNDQAANPQLAELKKQTERLDIGNEHLAVIADVSGATNVEGV